MSKLQCSSTLPQKVMICQSYKIGCVWKPGFLKSGHIYHEVHENLYISEISMCTGYYMQ